MPILTDGLLKYEMPNNIRKEITMGFCKEFLDLMLYGFHVGKRRESLDEWTSTYAWKESMFYASRKTNREAVYREYCQLFTTPALAKRFGSEMLDIIEEYNLLQ